MEHVALINDWRKTLKILLYLFLSISGFILNGFAICKLWEWFVVPTFNIAELTFVSALGIFILVRYLTTTIGVKEEDEKPSEKKFVKALIIDITRPVFALLFGYILSMFM